MTGRIALAALCVLACASRAQAQEHGITVGGYVRYDDNIRRSPDTVRSDLNHNGGDIVTYVSAQGHLDTNIGSVSAKLKANAGHVAFLWNDQFNTFDYGASIAMDYSDGLGAVSLTAGHMRKPVALDEMTTAINAAQFLTTVGAVASRDVLGNLRLVGRVAYRRSRTDLAMRRADNQAFTYGGGLGYFSPTGSSISLEYAETRKSGLSRGSVLVNGVPQPYSPRALERSVGVRIDYDYSVLTQITGQIGYTKHNDLSLFDADFKGLTADIQIRWSPREGYMISPRYVRSFGTQNALYSNGVELSTVGVDVSGPIGARLGWSAHWQREKRTYRYDLLAPNAASLARTQTSTRYGASLSVPIGGRWHALLAAEHMSRTSNLTRFDYSENSVTLTISHDLAM